MRDRANDLLAEEDDLARALASTWGRDPDARLPAPARRPRPPARPAASRVDDRRSTPESPDSPMVNASGWGPVVGDGEGLANRLRELLADKFTRRRRRRRRRARRNAWRELLLDRGLDFAIAGARHRPHPARRLHRRRPAAPRLHGAGREGGRSSPRAISPAAAAPTAQARPRKRQGTGLFEDLKPGNYVVHYQHGVGQYEGMVKRTIGGVERDYLLLAYKGGDKLYVPERPDRHAAPVRRRRGAGAAPPRRRRLRQGQAPGAQRGARDRPGARGALPEAGATPRATRSARTRRGSTRWRRRSRSSRRPTSARRSTTSRPTWSAPYPMDRLVCGDVGFGKTEVAIRAAFKAIQDGKQVAVLAPTTLLATQHGNTFADRFAGYPIRVEVLSRFLTSEGGEEGHRGLEDRRGRLRHRHPPPAAGRRRCSRTSACSWSTRSSASACRPRRR